MTELATSRTERVLETSQPGLALKPLTPADAKDYHSLIVRNRIHLTRFGDYAEEGGADFDWVIRHLTSTGDHHLRWGLRLNEELVGRIDLIAVDPPRYGLGYWLDREATGHGYMTAACMAVFDEARSGLAASDVFAGVTHGNRKSVQLLRRLGFKRVGQFESYDRYRLRL